MFSQFHFSLEASLPHPLPSRPSERVLSWLGSCFPGPCLWSSSWQFASPLQCWIPWFPDAVFLFFLFVFPYFSASSVATWERLSGRKIMKDLKNIYSTVWLTLEFWVGNYIFKGFWRQCLFLLRSLMLLWCSILFKFFTLWVCLAPPFFYSYHSEFLNDVSLVF